MVTSDHVKYYHIRDETSDTAVYFIAQRNLARSVWRLHVDVAVGLSTTLCPIWLRRSRKSKRRPFQCL